jgi:LysR family transcriptional regulator for metE and metH
MISAISESTNLKTAAALLNISPSALTHRVKEAEQIVGAKLFNKLRGGLQLTPAGTILLNAAQTCIRELDKAERSLADGNLGLIKTVEFGASTLCALHWLPDFLRFLERGHPEIELELGVDIAVDLIGALRHKNIDLALMPLKVESTALKNVFLFHDEMVAVLPQTHPKASRPYLEAIDFLDETYIGIRPGRERGREYERFFGPAAVTPKRLMPGRSIETVIVLVRAGMGITIMTRWSAQHYLSAHDLRAIPLTNQGLPIEWYAVIRDEESGASPVTKVAGRMAEFWRD